ncbi:MAG: hypothetical protein H6619_04360 [Deltaproteobacteria bacterium]|nr:hypothetical protein [Deltaproteobacteria bacterium]
MGAFQTSLVISRKFKLFNSFLRILLTSISVVTIIGCGGAGGFEKGGGTHGTGVRSLEVEVQQNNQPQVGASVELLGDEFSIASGNTDITGLTNLKFADSGFETLALRVVTAEGKEFTSVSSKLLEKDSVKVELMDDGSAIIQSNVSKSSDNKDIDPLFQPTTGGEAKKNIGSQQDTPIGDNKPKIIDENDNQPKSETPETGGDIESGMEGSLNNEDETPPTQAANPTVDELTEEISSLCQEHIEDEDACKAWSEYAKEELSGLEEGLLERFQEVKGQLKETIKRYLKDRSKSPYPTKADSKLDQELKDIYKKHFYELGLNFDCMASVINYLKDYHDISDLIAAAEQGIGLDQAVQCSEDQLSKQNQEEPALEDEKKNESELENETASEQMTQDQEEEAETDAEPTQENENAPTKKDKSGARR